MMSLRRSVASATATVAALLSVPFGTLPAPAAATLAGDGVSGTADGTAVVEFAETSRTVDELGQYPFPPLTVTRSGDTTVPATVSYARTAGTATPGQDFALGPGELTFAAGETSKSIPLQIYPDTVFEPSETIVVTLGSPGDGTTLGEASSMTVTIADNDAPRLQFDNLIYRVSETGGSATIRVTRAADPAVPVGVDYATSNGSATEGSDYLATSGTLSFAAGETSKTFAVPVVEDVAVESEEVVRLTLSAPTGGAVLGALSTARLYITDSHPAVVQFEQTAQTVSEDAGVVHLMVTRHGNVGVPATVDYAQDSGTATPSSDFTVAPGTLSFAARETTKTIPVTVTNDSGPEAAETLVLALTSPGAGTAVGPVASTTLTIGPSDQQPDALVSTARTTGFLGHDVYNTTGVGQTRTLTARRTQARTFYVRVQNDGQVVNAIAIKGTAATAGSTVRYFSGTQNITTQMRSAAGWVAGVQPGASKLVGVRIKVLAGAAFGSVKSAKVSGTWKGDGTRIDLAAAAVKVVR